MDADAAQPVRVPRHDRPQPGMQELFDSIRRLAPHVRTVLITGETGTGKELVARAFHAGRAAARQNRFLTVNCSAVVDTLFESELFGHQRGVVHGRHRHEGRRVRARRRRHAVPRRGGRASAQRPAEAAAGGRVRRSAARRLARDEAACDVRVIAATNRDLRAECAAGRFRSDLFFRLSIIEIHLAPLRERREDIPTAHGGVRARIRGARCTGR